MSLLTPRFFYLFKNLQTVLVQKNTFVIMAVQPWVEILIVDYIFLNMGLH